MQLSTSQMPLQSASPHSPDANTSNAAFRFLDLPPEVRLIIYNELLVQSDDLLRTFCKCKFCANLNGPTMGRDCLNPSLLRTNKAIRDEALPALYSKNVFLFFCWELLWRSRRTSVSRHRNGDPGIVAQAGDDDSKIHLIANRQSPWTGAAKIIRCPSDAAKMHVRRIFFKLDWLYHTVLDGFPTQWWQPVESDALRCFPGLEQIMVKIVLREMPVPTFYTVFQRKYLIVKRTQSYQSLLADEAICDAIVASYTQGEMKNCIFGVKLVSWTPSNLLAVGPESMEHLNTSIHLGSR